MLASADDIVRFAPCNPPFPGPGHSDAKVKAVSAELPMIKIGQAEIRPRDRGAFKCQYDVMLLFTTGSGCVFRNPTSVPPRRFGVSPLSRGDDTEKNLIKA